MNVIETNGKISSIYDFNYLNISYRVIFVESILIFVDGVGWVTKQLATPFGFHGNIQEGLGCGDRIKAVLGNGPNDQSNQNPVKQVYGPSSTEYVFNYYNNSFGAWELEEYTLVNELSWISKGQIQLGDFYKNYDEMCKNPGGILPNSSGRTVTLAQVTIVNSIMPPSNISIRQQI